MTDHGHEEYGDPLVVGVVQDGGVRAPLGAVALDNDSGFDIHIILSCTE